MSADECSVRDGPGGHCELVAKYAAKAQLLDEIDSLVRQFTAGEFPLPARCEHGGKRSRTCSACWRVQRAAALATVAQQRGEIIALRAQLTEALARR